MASQSSTIAKIIKGLDAQGARIKETTKGYQIMCPNGDIITMHKTPSDHRAMRNTRARVKRAGLDWPLD